MATSRQSVADWFSEQGRRFKVKLPGEWADANEERAVECGDWSPLFAGDLSPSSIVAGGMADRHSRSRERGWRLGNGKARASDGDKSPAESGENSPHSKACVPDVLMRQP